MEDGIPTEPGEVAVREMNGPGGQPHGHYCYFTCPRGTGLCGVPIKPLGHPPHNDGWDWDGNVRTPTLSPSIKCTGGCQWHGYVRGGTLVDA